MLSFRPDSSKAIGVFVRLPCLVGGGLVICVCLSWCLLVWLRCPSRIPNRVLSMCLQIEMCVAAVSSPLFMECAYKSTVWRTSVGEINQMQDVVFDHSKNDFFL